MLHKILLRQLIKQYGSEDRIPTELNTLFESVSAVYQHADEDRKLIERSLDISSRELEAINLQLRSEHDLIESEVIKRTQELVAERNRISLTLASITDAVIALDLENRIIIFNKAAEVLLNKSSKEVLGRKIGEIIRVYDNHIEITPDEYARSVAEKVTGIVFTKKALKYVSGDKVGYVNFISGNITDGQQANMGCIISMHDVSEERQLEEMKIDFVSMAAHELRTPLTVIRGYASMLQDKKTQNLSADQEKFVDRLAVSADTLSNLIDNLLNVSRIEHNLLRLDLKVVDLEKNIHKIIDDLSNSARTKGQSLTFVKEKESFPLVKVDNFRIGEVLINLIGNAITYTEAGGSIEVKLEQKDNMLIVSIKDTGPGIPPEAIPKLFSKFFRVGGALERGSKGTGLGLYISKSIVEMHGGQIGVESEPGHGARFYFKLPITTEKEVAHGEGGSVVLTERSGFVLNNERQNR